VSYYLSDAMGGHVLDTAKPQPGGCLTQWHVHTNLCLSRGLGVVGVVTAAHPTCPAVIEEPRDAAERVHAPRNGPA